METVTNTIQEILPTLEQLKSGVQSFVENGVPESTYNPAALIFIAVVGIFTCFLGLKLIRLWGALIGLTVGFVLGYIVGLCVGFNQPSALIAGLAVGVILAVLSGVLCKVGIFILCFVLGSYMAITILNPSNAIMSILCAVIGLVLAIIALKLSKSITIILTSAGGGLLAGVAITELANLEPMFMPYVIGGVLMVIGMVIQFIYISKKKDKKIMEKAQKIKEEKSVENEVEAARTILDDLDEEPEAVVAPKESEEIKEEVKEEADK